MKKAYFVPESEVIRTELEMGLLTVTGGDDPIHENSMEPDDRDHYRRLDF